MDEDNKLDLFNTSITINSNGKKNAHFSNQRMPFSKVKD